MFCHSTQTAGLNVNILRESKEHGMALASDRQSQPVLNSKAP